MKTSRRSFLGQAVAGTAAEAVRVPDPAGERALRESVSESSEAAVESSVEVDYPRVFEGRHLNMIAFPLGGVAAGSISLGGRGQLRDWEIFNRADKGNNLQYAFPSIWVRAGDHKAIARVLEARYQPPYEGQNGLGSQNAPGLSRLASARFTGEYPLARIDFEDEELPVRVSLEAFSPFIPHEPDDSGLPVAILRYRVTNSGTQSTRAAIAWSIENPVMPSGIESPQKEEIDKRRNEFRRGDALSGLFMTNPGLAASDSYHGSFGLALLRQGDGKLTYIRGWPKGRWWNSPLLFWDDFSADGELGPEAEPFNSVGALCLSRTIPAGVSANYEFLLAWHFPNRTPARCGWKAPKGEENTVIGNWYSARFRDAWDAAEYAAFHLQKLERKTRLFAVSLRESTLLQP